MVLEYMNKYKDEIKRCINDLKCKNAFYKQIPNLLTFSRAIGVIPINILYFTGNIIPSVILTGLILSTDLFDGKLARKWNVQSSFGADLDAFCDKIMFLGLSIPLIISNPIVLLNFIFEGAISLVNVLGRVNGINTRTVMSGKVKTCFLSLMLIMGYLTQFLNLPIHMFNILVGITFVSQGIAFSNYIKEYKRMNNEKKYDILINEDSVKKDNIVYKREDSLLEQLKREKEFYISFKQPDIVKCNKRVRNMNNKRKSNN